MARNKSKRSKLDSSSPKNPESSSNDLFVTEPLIIGNRTPLVKAINLTDLNSDIADYKNKVEEVQLAFTKMQSILSDLTPLTYLLGKHEDMEINMVKQAETFLDFIAAKVVKQLTSLHKAIVYNVPGDFPLKKVRATLLKASGMSHIPCECNRLRKKDWQTSCPILFHFASIIDCKRFIKSVNCIRSCSDFKNILIVADKTPLQRRSLNRYGAVVSDIEDSRLQLTTPNKFSKTKSTTHSSGSTPSPKLCTPPSPTIPTTLPSIDTHTPIPLTTNENGSDLVDLDITPKGSTLISQNKEVNRIKPYNLIHHPTVKTETEFIPYPYNRPNALPINKAQHNPIPNIQSNKISNKRQTARDNISESLGLKASVKNSNKWFLSYHPISFSSHKYFKSNRMTHATASEHHVRMTPKADSRKKSLLPLPIPFLSRTDAGNNFNLGCHPFYQHKNPPRLGNLQPIYFPTANSCNCNYLAATQNSLPNYYDPYGPNVTYAHLYPFFAYSQMTLHNPFHSCPPPLPPYLNQQLMPIVNAPNLYHH
ncbi:hypothetical protein MN116_000096 [Schistosoma mekongi]|uniref:Uncharacterized protein n=1 Tax=Schistosoma mekongi TaxID=38744 RepID=A0AAE1Z8A8_SCHME|nr:hypothetical protein MN116_000096 [Schistosoma mekongi]